MNRAKQLRSNPTPAEVRLWRLLYPFRTNGFHFRKQVPVGPYYADFVCHHAHIIIEVDGDTHYSKEAIAYDARRDAFMQSKGYTILRFTNEDVTTNRDGIYTIVANSLTSRPLNQRLDPDALEA
jgi:very-short-patch-repair endonuclease